MTHSFSQHNDQIQILQVHSLLNEYDNKSIMKDVEKQISQGWTKFVLDLSLMDIMNSVGLNFLIFMMKKSQNSGGNLAVANASDNIVKLLEVTKLKPFFQLSSSVDEAMKNLEG
ncbi:MAG: anti-sigma B factor antagonist [Granulosicoccus sp.]|jgi:anti-sigma B factor antagonist